MKKILVAIVLILLLFFGWKQYRHFYKVDDIVFTVWKTTTGYCYITPYIYLGFSAPEDNFIKASNVTLIDIFVKDKSTLIIFNDEYNVGAVNEVECHFTKLKCIHCPTPERMEWKRDSEISLSEIEQYFKQREIWGEEWEMCEKTMPHILLDIRYMNVSTHEAPSVLP